MDQSSLYLPDSLLTNLRSLIINGPSPCWYLGRKSRKMAGAIFWMKTSNQNTLVPQLISLLLALSFSSDK